MQLQTGTWCPLIQADCVGTKCVFFTHVTGWDSNTGKQVDEWDCSFKWLPALLIENTNQQRHTAAAVESHRNESVKRADVTNHILFNTALGKEPTIEGVEIQAIAPGGLQ